MVLNRKYFLLLLLLTNVLSFEAVGEPNSIGPNVSIRGKIQSNSIKNFDQFIIFIENLITKVNNSKHAIIDQKNISFVPHVLPLTVGNSIIFRNSDKESHILHSQKAPYNFHIKLHPGQMSKPYKFLTEGEFTLTCDFHPHMSAYILVLNSSYFSTSDKNGEFEIKNIPPGVYKITTWHPRYISKTMNISVNKEPKLYTVTFEY